MTETPTANPIVAELQQRLDQITAPMPDDHVPDLAVEDCIIVLTDPLWLIQAKTNRLQDQIDTLNDFHYERDLVADQNRDAITAIAGAAAATAYDHRRKA